MHNEPRPTREFHTSGKGPVAVDHLEVSTSGLAFVLHKVPGSLGPRWSKNVGIEYTAIDGAPPGEAQRDAVTEFVSGLDQQDDLTLLLLRRR